MKEFLAQFCKRNEKKINPDLFNRTFDKPLVDYIVDTCKNLEVLPGVKLESYEYITDQTKIHMAIDKRNKRDPKIRNNRCLERLTSPNHSVYDLLVLHFTVTAKGQKADVERRIWVPKLIKGRYYIRGGKKVLPLIQIVDNSTFVKQGKKKTGNVLNFKTTLYPIKVNTVPQKLHFTNGTALMGQVFNIDLFTKTTNPLLYFLARYGMEDTIEMFNLERVMFVTHDEIDPKKYLYLKINSNVYLEVEEKTFYAHEFVGKFVASMYDVLRGDKDITLQDVYNRDYWLERLGAVFSKKTSVNKGERVLISFRKVMDPHTKKRLSLKKYQKKNTFTIMKWMLTNYEELLKKDSNDLRTKRMRANETQAFFIDSYITKNVNSLLNTDDPSFERYMRLFNAISEDVVLKSSHSVAGKSSQTSMFRFERYNDFDAIELCRYTLKGPTGLNGGKQKTNLRYRDIYPSHLGRYDPNVCSSSDPGLTGYLCANVQFDENGYFDSDKTEPNAYDGIIDKLIDKRCEEGYLDKRREILEVELSRDEEGFVKLRKRKSQEEMTAEFNKNPWEYGLYWLDGELHMMPKLNMNRDAKGFLILKNKTPEKRRMKSDDDVERDEDGFIKLIRLDSADKKSKLGKKK